MDRERFKKQIDFVLEIDKEKNILRQTHLTDYRRQENDAEHAWHMAVMIYLLKEYANEQDASDVFGISAEHTDIDGGKLDYDAYIDVARQLTEKFGFKKVAITLRGSISASRNTWAGMLYDGETDKAEFSKEYDILIVDRVGGGDSFGGGLIYALTSEYDDKKAIEFAAAASCLKHTIEHDFNLVSVKEVETLMNGNGSGRVQR